MRGLRAPHSLYVRAEKRRNQAVLEMRGFLSPAPCSYCSVNSLLMTYRTAFNTFDLRANRFEAFR